MRRLVLIGLALGATTACSSADGLYVEDTTDFDDGDSLEGLSLRLDVVPPDGVRANADAETVGPPGALPQSFPFDTLDGLTLELLEAVTVRGTVTGYVSSPWSVDVPGSTLPIGGATVSLRLPGTLQSANGVTNDGTVGAAGSFALRVAPSAGYALNVQPPSPLVAPFAATVDTASDEPVVIDIPLGLPVWGRVLDPDGAPIVGARVFAFHDDGIRTAVAETDSRGWWLIRVPAGVWSFECDGRDHGRDPTIVTRDVEVDGTGATFDFQYPSLRLGTLVGRVIDASGDGVGGVTARLRAGDLTGYDGYEYSSLRTVKTDDDGNFTAVVVSGEWRVELIPPDSAELGPLDVGDVQISASDVEDLADLALEPTVTLVGQVVDAEGLVLPGAVVSAREQAFGQRGWTSVTDATGTFAMTVSDVPLALEILPPGDRGDLALGRVEVATPSAEVVQASLQVGVPASGVVQFLGEPVPFAVVEATDESGTRWATGLSGPDGTFELRLPRP